MMTVTIKHKDGTVRRVPWEEISPAERRALFLAWAAMLGVWCLFAGLLLVLLVLAAPVAIVAGTVFAVVCCGAWALDRVSAWRRRRRWRRR